MRTATYLVFDEFLPNQFSVPTSSIFDEVLGRFDQLAFHVVVDNVDEFGGLLYLHVETSADGITWFDLGIAALGTIGWAAQNLIVGSYPYLDERDRKPLLAFVRLTVQLAGSTASGHVRVYATGRDSGVVDAIAPEIVEQHEREKEEEEAYKKAYDEARKKALKKYGEKVIQWLRDHPSPGWSFWDWLVAATIPAGPVSTVLAAMESELMTLWEIEAASFVSGVMGDGRIRGEWDLDHLDNPNLAQQAGPEMESENWEGGGDVYVPDSGGDSAQGPGDSGQSEAGGHEEDIYSEADNSGVVPGSLEIADESSGSAGSASAADADSMYAAADAEAAAASAAADAMYAAADAESAAASAAADAMYAEADAARAASVAAADAMYAAADAGTPAPTLSPETAPGAGPGAVESLARPGGPSGGTGSEGAPAGSGALLGSVVGPPSGPAIQDGPGALSVSATQSPQQSAPGSTAGSGGIHDPSPPWNPEQLPTDPLSGEPTPDAPTPAMPALPPDSPAPAPLAPQAPPVTPPASLPDTGYYGPPADVAPAWFVRESAIYNAQLAWSAPAMPLPPAAPMPPPPPTTFAVSPPAAGGGGAGGAAPFSLESGDAGGEGAGASAGDAGAYEPDDALLILVPLGILGAAYVPPWVMGALGLLDLAQAGSDRDPHLMGLLSAPLATGLGRGLAASGSPAPEPLEPGGSGSSYQWVTREPTPRMVNQELEYSCGAACMRQSLLDRGMDIPEADLRDLAGYSDPAPGVSGGIRSDALGRAADQVMPGENWTGGPIDMYPEEALARFSDPDHPSWYAMLDRHWVIVDEVGVGGVSIRDPWGMFGPGSGEGAQALLTWDQFTAAWRRGLWQAVAPGGLGSIPIR